MMTRSSIQATIFSLSQNQQENGKITPKNMRGWFCEKNFCTGHAYMFEFPCIFRSQCYLPFFFILLFSTLYFSSSSFFSKVNIDLCCYFKSDVEDVAIFSFFFFHFKKELFEILFMLFHFTGLLGIFRQTCSLTY